MEVWDPFGDLQVVVEAVGIEEKPKTQRTRQGRPAPRKHGQGAAKGQRGKPEAPGIGAGQPLPDITETKPEATDAPAPDEARRPADPPQLQIDFPSKTEE